MCREIPEYSRFSRFVAALHVVTIFDLDIDLEHTLDAGYAGDHRVQVWWRFLSNQKSVRIT